jgi:hypothetical protein
VDAGAGRHAALQRFVTAPLAIVAGFAALLVSLPAVAAERVVDLPTRPGATVRLLLSEPARPIAGVVLLTGSNGRVIVDDRGRITAGGGNQLVRSRARYEAAGFVVAVPDFASDRRVGGDNRAGDAYRLSADSVQDIGAVIRLVAGLKRPVALIGTSRGTLSAAYAAASLAQDRPDALVLTSGLLMPVGNNPSVASSTVLERLDMPVLLMAHADDQCRITPPSGMAGLKPKLVHAPRVDTITLTGGGPPRGDPCEAQSFHGYVGLDDQVVTTIAGWLAGALHLQR